MTSAIRKKLMVVGDDCVGKTCLQLRIKDEKFGEEHIPNILKLYQHSTVNVDHNTVDLTLFESTKVEYESLRQLSYKNTDVVVIVFSIADPDSLDNVNGIWVPEIRDHLPNVPILLVGNKTDLRNDTETIANLRKRQREPVKKEQGEEMAKRIKAVRYLECSAKHARDVGTVKEVFHAAARAALQVKKEKSRPCTLI